MHHVDTLDLLGILFSVQDTLEGIGMGADLAVFAAIIIFVGGLVFWVLMVCAGLHAMYRGILRLWDVAYDARFRRRVRAAK